MFYPVSLHKVYTDLFCLHNLSNSWWLFLFCTVDTLIYHCWHLCLLYFFFIFFSFLSVICVFCEDIYKCVCVWDQGDGDSCMECNIQFLGKQASILAKTYPLSIQKNSVSLPCINICLFWLFFFTNGQKIASVACMLLLKFTQNYFFINFFLRFL